MLTSAFLVFALTAGSFATPAALTARQNPCQACENVMGGIDTLAYNFTLSVVDPSASGPSATGPTIYLEQGPEYIWWLQRVVEPSTPIDFLSWKLQKGALIPNPSASGISNGLVGSDFAVPVGSIVKFAITSKGAGDGNAGRTPYCVVTDAEGDATLAVNGNTEGFAVCETPSQAQVLVYEPTSVGNGTYDYSSCTSQKVQLVKA